MPLCSLRLLVDTTPRLLAESYAEDEDSRTTFQLPVVSDAPPVEEVNAWLEKSWCCCWRLCKSRVGDSESRISLDLSDMKPPPWPWMDSACEPCVRTSPLSVMEETDVAVFLVMICWPSPTVCRSRSTSPVV